MESYSSSNIPIFFRFSHACSLLRYYDDFSKGELLMTSLGTKSRDCWNSQYDAFGMALEYVRKSLKYISQFDKDISEFLLTKNKLKQFELELVGESPQSYIDLLEFLESVYDLNLLKIKSITGTVSDYALKPYNQLGRFFIEKELCHLPISVIASTLKNFTFGYDELEYMSQVYLTYSSKEKIPKGIDKLEIKNSKLGTIFLKTFDGNASTLVFSSFIGENTDDVPFLSDQLKNSSVHTLEFKFYKTKFYPPIRPFIEYFKQNVKNFKHVIFDLPTFEFDLFGEFLKAYERFSINIGVMKYDDGTIVKYFPRLYYVDKENKIFKFVKANKMVLQYGKGGGLIFSNNDILVFKNATYLELKEVHDNSHNEAELSTFIKCLEKVEKTLAKQNKYFVMLNNDIDRIVIHQGKNANFPNANGKQLALHMSLSSKVKMMTHLESFVKTIRKSTEINLILEFSYNYNATLEDEIVKAAASVLEALDNCTVTSIKHTGHMQLLTELVPLTKLICENDNLKHININVYPKQLTLRHININNFYKIESFLDGKPKKLSKKEEFMNNIIIS